MRLYWVALILILLDRGTKMLVEHLLEFGSRIALIPGFLYLTLHYNTGAAWGILQGRTTFLIVVSGLVIVAMIWALPKFQTKMLRWSICFIIGGAVGNQIDRMAYGRVTDFIDFQFWSYNYPVFNAADSFIVIGSVILVFYVLFRYDENDFLFLQRKKRGDRDS